MRVNACSQIQQIYGASVVSKARKGSAVSQGRDAVEISNVGKTYQSVKDAVMNAPDIREPLVSSIKEQIKAGTYDVSSMAFADKLLEKYAGSPFEMR